MVLSVEINDEGTLKFREDNSLCVLKGTTEVNMDDSDIGLTKWERPCWKRGLSEELDGRGVMCTCDTV